MGIPLVTCALCEGEWLAQSITRLFTAPEGFGVCKECEEELVEEEFLDSVYNTDTREYEGQEREQPQAFSYTSHRKEGGSWDGFHKRIFTISMPCCIPDCDDVAEFVQLTRPIRSNVFRVPEECSTSAPNLTQTNKGATYEETYFACDSHWLRGGEPVECAGERIYPEDGEDISGRRGHVVLSGRLCEEDGHVCMSCLGAFKNLYGANRDDTIRAYQAWRASSTQEDLAEYRELAYHRRQLRRTRNEQFKKTTAILDEFVGGDGGKSCARLGAESRCALSTEKEMVPISIPRGRFVGDGYLCQSCLDGD